MPAQLTCGQALVHLLEQYGVDTVFGIPGVHTLDLYHGLAGSTIQHVQTRHEQGAGFMADGYARVSGKPGVCFLISGPGVTNAATALGQAYADSIPMMIISSITASHTLGKGWGCLHEISDQQAATAPLTALSATALSPDEVPGLIAQAYAIFESGRPRPVHISIPIDVLAMTTGGNWAPRTPPARPHPNPAQVQAAAEILAHAERPTLYVGGGALKAGSSIIEIAELLNAGVISSNAGKGIVPDSHPLNLGASVWRSPTQRYLAQADALLAVGTELSETDSFIERLEINGRLIRVDIDPAKINDLYPADVGIVADATATADVLLDALKKKNFSKGQSNQQQMLNSIRAQIVEEMSPIERQHVTVLNTLRRPLPDNTAIMADITQLVYTGSFAMPVEQPGCWHYPAGYCTLGCALPMAIGAKIAQPNRPVIALVGDGGFLFTVQELATAAELELSLPIVLWNNSGLGQIRDDMERLQIPPIGVNPRNPDFVALAKAFGCRAVQPDSLAALESAVNRAISADRPTLIELKQDSDWLRN